MESFKLRYQTYQSGKALTGSDQDDAELMIQLQRAPQRDQSGFGLESLLKKFDIERAIPQSQDSIQVYNENVVENERGPGRLSGYPKALAIKAGEEGWALLEFSCPHVVKNAARSLPLGYCQLLSKYKALQPAWGGYLLRHVLDPELDATREVLLTLPQEEKQPQRYAIQMIIWEAIEEYYKCKDSDKHARFEVLASGYKKNEDSFQKVMIKRARYRAEQRFNMPRFKTERVRPLKRPPPVPVEALQMFSQQEQEEEKKQPSGPPYGGFTDKWCCYEDAAIDAWASHIRDTTMKPPVIMPMVLVNEHIKKNQGAKKMKRDHEFFSQITAESTLIVPMCLYYGSDEMQQHWVLAQYKLRENVTYIFDSIQISDYPLMKRAYKRLQENVIDALIDKHHSFNKLAAEQWKNSKKLVIMGGAPVQQDQENCGAYVCWAMEHLSNSGGVSTAEAENGFQGITGLDAIIPHKKRQLATLTGLPESEIIVHVDGFDCSNIH